MLKEKVYLFLSNSRFGTIYFIVGILSLLLKLLIFIYPFFGLEYEDAFIFTDVGRALSIRNGLNSLSYQTETCAVGSLNECQFSMTYGGHFIPFPLLVSFVDRIFGYSPHNIFWINSILSLLALFVALKIVDLLSAGNKKAVLIGGAILISTPFYCIFNTSGLSETFSSVFVLLAVYFYLRTKNDNTWRNFNFLFSIIFLSCTFLIKRENLVLLSIPFVDLLLNLIKGKGGSIIKPLIIALATSLIAFLLYKGLFNVFSIEHVESDMIGQNTFSLNYAFKLFPVFIKSLISINYFSFFGIFILLTPLIIFVTKDLNIRLLIILAWIYLLVYSFHYRGYYFVKFNEISTFDTLRFYTNFFPLFVIPIICFICALTKIRLRSNITIVGFAVIIVILNSCLYFRTRSHLSEIENYERIAPVKSVLAFMRPGDAILTDLPIVFHVYSPPDVFIVDYNSMNEVVEREIVDLSKRERVFILRNRFDKEDRMRYPFYFKFLETHCFKFMYEIDEKYEVCQIVE